MSHPRRLAFIAAVSLALVGCGALTDNSLWNARLDGLTAVYSWSAQGSMRFACSYDEAGSFWQAVGAEAELKSDDGRTQATLSYNGIIHARDGSSIVIKVVQAAAQQNAANLRTALYEVEGADSTGLLRGIRLVERKHAQGGMPLAPCSPAQRGQRLDVPFTARFIFWR